VKDSNSVGQFAVITLLGLMFGATISLVKFPQTFMAGDADCDKCEWKDETFTGGTSFLIAFGFAKGPANLVVGLLADKFGRKPPQVIAWLVGIIVPIMIIGAKNWDTVVAANVFLGIQQGLGWTTQIFMSVDVAGRQNAGVAIGIASGLGYIVAAIMNFVGAAMIVESADDDKRNYREDVYYLVVVLMGLSFLISIWPLKETIGHAHREHDRVTGESVEHIHSDLGRVAEVKWPSGQVLTVPMPLMAFVTGTFLKRSLVALWIGGITTNACVGMAWGLMLQFMKKGNLESSSLIYGETVNEYRWGPFDKDDIAYATAVFGCVRGASQVFCGMMGDYIGRKKTIIGGFVFLLCSVVILSTTGRWAGSDNGMLGALGVEAVMMGFGVGTVYPNLMGAVSDHADPSWRGSALGTYRFWRDIGYAIGTIMAGEMRESFEFDQGLTEAQSFSAAIGVFCAIICFAIFCMYFLYEEKLASIEDFKGVQSYPSDYDDDDEEDGSSSGPHKKSPASHHSGSDGSVAAAMVPVVVIDDQDDQEDTPFPNPER
jgi:MFS family permease